MNNAFIPSWKITKICLEIIESCEKSLSQNFENARTLEIF